MAQPLPLKPKLKNKNKVKSEKEILCPTPTPKEILVGDIKGGNDGIYVIGKIGSKRIPMLVDTGASVTIVSTQFYKNLKLEKPQLTQVSIKLTSASGDIIPVSGECPIQISLENFQVTHKVLVADIQTPCILGLDFMTQNSCDLFVKKMKLKVQGLDIPCFSKSCVEVVSCSKISLAEDIEIPPHCEFIAPAKVDNPLFKDEVGVIEPIQSFVEKYELLIPQTLITVDSEVAVRYMNLKDESVKLYKNTQIATVNCVDKVLEREVSDDSHTLNTLNPEFKPQFPDHLQCIVEKLPNEVTLEQKQKLQNLIIEYQNSFSTTSTDMGLTNLVEHKINTGNAPPIKQHPRRLPLAKMGEVEKEIEDMLDKGVIETSNSPWSSPIVLVKKKDGSIRFCIDYRKLNDVTIKDSYPIPRIDSTLDALAGAKWFSTIDLKSGYWQVKMAPDDKPKTAFSIPGGGHWQFLNMPFGLCNAGATFERLMEKVLSNLSWKICMVYLDDIIILSQTFDEHIINLKQVFHRLKGANLKMNPKKCYLLQKQVSFLGHIVDENGVATDPSKIESVINWPTPSSVKNIRSFLGLCSYYRKFIYKFADIAKPLHKLTESKQEFRWDENCQEAFDKLKRALTSAPILSYPNNEGLFILDTDASNNGLGAVLSQEQNGSEKVICYYSKTFSATERRYCVTRRELLAIVKSIKNFHHYLYGRPFKVRTDHGSLTWLLNFKNPEGQIARWFELLSQYEFKVEHRAGRSHSNADALSRRPCPLDCKH